MGPINGLRRIRRLPERLEERLAPVTRWVDSTPSGNFFTASGGTQPALVGPLTPGVDLFPTIGAAVAAAKPGDTINVADGTYAELVVIDKTLTLQGNQFGADARGGRAGAAESIVANGTGDFQVRAADVVLDGFTVQGVNVDPAVNPASLGAGISTTADQGDGVQILNDVVQDNIAGISLVNGGNSQAAVQFNLVQNNNLPGRNSGNGIFSDQGLVDALIDSNTVSGNAAAGVRLAGDAGTQSNVTVSQNTLTGNGSAVVLLNTASSSITQNTILASTAAQVVLGGGDSILQVTQNFLDGGAAQGIHILDTIGGSPSSSITVRNNSFLGNATPGLAVDGGGISGSLDATLDYWGSTIGPATPNNPGGNGDRLADTDGVVNFSPYLSDGSDSSAAPGFQPVPGGTTGIAVVGTKGDDTLLVNAGSESPFYVLDSAKPVFFRNVTRFTFAAGAGQNSFLVNNPAGGLFAPRDGIAYDGGGAASLDIQGGSSARQTFTFRADGATGHAGGIDLVSGPTTAHYDYQGLSPVLVQAGTPGVVVINLPAGDGDNQAILEDSGKPGDGLSQVRSQNGTFETTVFVDPTTLLQVNSSSDGEGMTLAGLDSAFNAGIGVNGGGGNDTFTILATPARTTTTFNAGPGGSHTFVGTGSLDSILGSVVVNGSGNADQVIIDDTASGTDRTLTITSTQVGAAPGDQFFAPGGSLTYSAVATLAVRLGSGNDAVHAGALAGTALDLDAGPPETAPGDTLFFDAAGRDVTDTGTRLQQPGRQPISYATFESIVLLNSTAGLIVQGGDGGAALVVDATDAGSGVYQLTARGVPGPPVSFGGIHAFAFQGGSGDDTFTIDNFSDGLFAPTGGIRFDGGPGQDGLEDLGGLATSGRYTSTGADATGKAGLVTHSAGNGTQQIAFTGLEPLTDTVVEGDYTLDGTDAAEQIVLQNGPVLANGTQTLRFTSSDPAVEQTDFAGKTNVTIDAGQTAADGSDNIVLLDTLASTDLATLSVNTGPAGGGSGSGDVVLVRSTPAGVSTVINGDAGADRVRIASFNDTLDTILGPVAVHGRGGADTLQLADENTKGVTPGHQYTITATTVNRDGMATITYDTVETFQLDARNTLSPAGNRIDLTGAAAAAYTINAGGGDDSVTAGGTGGAASLTINGQGGSDALTVSFAAGNPAPAGGLDYNAGGQSGDTLALTGVNAGTVTGTFLPDDAAGHRGSLAVDAAVVRYGGVKPISIGGTLADLVLNLPTGDGDNQARLAAANGQVGASQVSSDNGTFETTTFPDPSKSLTLNTGDDGETVTVSGLDAGFKAALTVRAGAGEDTLRGDFSGGNIIPAGGITFQGAGGNDGIVLFGNAFSAATIAYSYSGPTAGTLLVDGASLAFTGLAAAAGISDQLASASRTFTFGPTDDVVTLGDNPAANDGLSRIGSKGSSPLTDFRNPKAALTVNLGPGADSITAGPLDALSPPPTINLEGLDGSDVLPDGGDTFNVTPSPASTFNVDGDQPTAAPGDTLNVNTAGTTSPFVNATLTPAGFSGSYTFADRRPVQFQEIEAPPAVDLSVSKSDGQTSAVPGRPVTYTITVTNNGGVGVGGVGVTDTFPAALTGASYTSTASAGSGGNTPSGVGNIQDTVTLAPGGTVTYTVTATVDPSATGQLVNTATATPPAFVADPNPNNNSSTDTDTLTPRADLTVATTGPAQAAAGTDLTYTVSLTNNGPGDARAVSLQDVVPAGTTFVSEAQTSGPTFTFSNPAPGGGGTISGTLARLPAGAAAVFTVVLHVSPGTPDGTTVINTAAAGSGTGDPNPNNNFGSAKTAISALADLSVTQGAAPSPALAGQDLTWTLTVVNRGSADALAVTLTDQLPGGTTLQGDAASQGSAAVNGGVVTFSLGTLAAGGTATASVVVHVSPAAADGSTLANGAAVTSTTLDANPDDNAGTDTVTVHSRADLALTQTAAVNAVEGGGITVTLAVSNPGPSDAAAVVLADPVPAGATLLSSTFPGYDPATGQASLGTLAAGSGVTGALVFRLRGEGTVSSVASVSSPTADPAPANNTTQLGPLSVAELPVGVRGGVVLTPVVGRGMGVQTLATFRDPGGPGDRDYLAIIDWGDGHSVTATPANGGIVSLGPVNGVARFAVRGQHTWTTSGTLIVRVSVAHAALAPVTVLSTARVGGDLTLGGTGGADTLTVYRTAGGAAGSLTYVLNGAAPVSLTGVHSFTFLGQAGNDTMTVQAGNGAPLLAGLVRFDGGAGSNTLNVNAGGRYAVQSGPGNTVVVGGQTVTYARAQVQVQNAGGVPRARRAREACDGSFAAADPEGAAGG